MSLNDLIDASTETEHLSESGEVGAPRPHRDGTTVRNRQVDGPMPVWRYVVLLGGGLLLLGALAAVALLYR